MHLLVNVTKYIMYIYWEIQLANNQAQEFWAFSAHAPEPHFDPAGATVYTFLKVF